MVVKWLGKDFALDILAVFPLYGHFYCLFCSIVNKEVNRLPISKKLLSFVDGSFCFASFVSDISCIVQIYYI